MENSPNLTIELVWEDTDLEQLSISADNGRYRGTAKVYFAQGDVQLLANSIRDFPKTNSQREVFSGGREEDDLSFAKLVFHCVDGAGHAVLDVTLAESLVHHARPSTRNRVELELRFEPSALDDFCRALNEVARRTNSRAVLRGLDK
jgi:hypothetical protein